MVGASPLTYVVAYVEKYNNLDAGFLNHCIVIINETGKQGVSAHNDKHENSQFWDISLGFARTMEISDAKTARHVLDLQFADNSMSALDFALRHRTHHRSGRNDWPYIC
eukprot:COSAG02_NODE_27691_length_604_cov_1.437624_2_plen_109_part_00